MKKIILISILILTTSCSELLNTSDPKVNSYSVKNIPTKIINANNDFSIKLFQTLNPHDGDSNIFISPVSVSFALGMTMNGADGNTYEEMKSTLGFEGLDIETINKSYAGLINELYDASGGVAFNLANSIWYTDELSLQSEFDSLNSEYFRAKVEALDFGLKSSCKEIVNQWVEDQTENKIKDFTRESDFESIMLLINAIYFNASWQYQFDESETEEKYFYPNDNESVKCEIMAQRNEYQYYAKEGIQAVELPYANDNYSMLLIQPTNQPIDEFIAEFDRIQLAAMTKNFHKDSVNLFIPKLEIEYEKELGDILKEMGISDAFDAVQADFSKMFNELRDEIFIKLVRQKAFINLDEEGTEAAAATVVVMDWKSANGDQKNTITLNFNKN